MQLAAFWLIERCSTYSVRLDLLGTLLLGAKEDRTVQVVFVLLQQQLGSILLYYLLLLVVGALTGWLAQVLVRWLKLDRRLLWLRYDNQWHYLLSGEILETSDLRASIGLQDAKLIKFIFVDILMKVEKGNMLYSGILVDYELAADGGLRTLYLRQARRKALSNTSEAKISGGEEVTESQVEEYYDVAGDLLLVPYAQTLNVNLSYYLEEEESQAEETSEVEEITIVPAASGVQTDNNDINLIS